MPSIHNDTLLESYRRELAEIKDEQRTIQAEGGLHELSDAGAFASLTETLEQIRLRAQALEIQNSSSRWSDPRWLMNRKSYTA